MFTLHLNKILLYAQHGVHKEETIIGNEFEVTVAVSFNEQQKITSINDTINYVTVLEIVKLQFAKPQHLLETVAQDIVDAIYKIDRKIISITISIYKIHTPIVNFEGTVGITYTKTNS